MYQVSFYSLQYLQRYAPNELFIAKIEKERNSVNTGDWVTVLVFCNFPHGPLLKCARRTDRWRVGQSGNYMLSLHKKKLPQGKWLLVLDGMEQKAFTELITLTMFKFSKRGN